MLRNVAVALVGLALLVGGRVEAGCWDCEAEYQVGGWAYVCVGLGIGQYGHQYCQPGAEWEDDVWCQFSGTQGDCTSGGGGEGWCPGCRLYPLSRNPILLTTQVLVFDIGARGRLAEGSLIAVSGASGANPAMVGEQLFAVAHERLPSLVGYSVESNKTMTATDYRTAAGDRIGVSVRRMGDGYLVKLEESGINGSEPTITRVYVPEGQSAVLGVQIEDRRCAVVISPMTSTGDEATRESAGERYHRPFMDSVAQFRPQELIGLTLGLASAEEMRDRTVRALTESMLMSSLR